MPNSRPLDNVDLNLEYPQEEEIAMANIQLLSFYNFLYFPKRYNKFYERDLFFKEVDNKQINRWKSEYRKLIVKSLVNKPGQLFISKNPANMVRIEVLLGLFPNARFIFIYRNPYKVVESFYRFLNHIIPPLQLQSMDVEVSRKVLVDLYSEMIHHYYQTKDLIPAGNHIEIRFEDLIKGPLNELKKVYEQFDMKTYGEDLPLFKDYLEKNGKQPRGRYEISEQTIKLVNDNLLDLVKKWKYEVIP